MPTAGKLVAAILFAGLGALVTYLIIPRFPEGTNFGWFMPGNALIGLLAGWVVAGSRSGNGYRNAIGYSLTAMVSMVVWGLFIYSSIEMVERSIRKMYDGPVDAVVSVFELAVEYLRTIASFEVIAFLVIGSLICGLVTDFFAQRYP
jgi:uncharacterized membrane protein (GlpM family)